jgi:cell division protein ZipA
LETATLRWVIIVIGVLILASIFLFGNPDKKRKPRASRRLENQKSERREPTLEHAPDTEHVESAVDSESGQGEFNIGGFEAPVRTEPTLGSAPGSIHESDTDSDIGSATESAADSGAENRPAAASHDMVKSLFLMARDNHVINGAELLQVALNTGMEFGDMNIFHRRAEGAERPVFSLVNAAKPGHFDRDAWNSFETSGVALFMTLPGPAYALDAWDSMYATAQRMGELLRAQLLDEEHSPFTRQKEAQIREEMRDYDRRGS